MRFSGVLRAHMTRPPHYSPGLVSHLSGVPKATIVNWLEGRVTRPRRWQDLVRVADAIRLGVDQTEDLLAAAGHRSLAELATVADDADRTLLAPWVLAGTSDLAGAAPLPILATPFLGRSADREAVSALVVDADVRVVTLTGAAGAGKTRLAIEVARAVSGRFDDGAVYVGLAPLTESEMVPELVFQALGVGGDGEEARYDALSARHQLVVLDNFEHLLDARPAIAKLVAGAAGLTFLVTSRTVLHLYGEHRFEVVPLAIPDAEELTFEEVATSPAVALFAQRARAADPSFRLGPHNVGVVVEICRRLDGLPLAIELAAARSAVLGPEGLLTRLARSLGMLTWGARDLPGRHQSLQATLDWSLEQLDEPARLLFAQLSVFMSGCRVGGAEAVGPSLDPDEVLDALMVLVDHSLLRAVTIGADTRFLMLETVRAYAATLLTEEESDASHGRALRYVVDVASAIDGEAPGSSQTAWFARVDEELDNVRALLRWSLDHDEVTAAATIAASLLPFWLRSALAEGQRWLDLTLLEAERLSPSVLARSLHAAGRVARQRGDVTTAEQLLGKGLAVFQGLGDETGTARTLGGLGVVAYDRGDLDRSARLHRESLEIHRRHGDDAGMAAALTNLGEIARLQRQLQEAVALQHDSATRFAAAGDAIGQAAALTNLGAAQIEIGALDAAHVALAGAAALWQGAGERSDLAECLELFAALAARHRQPARGVRLAAAAAALRRAAGTMPSPAEADRHRADVETLRRAMEADQFTNAWHDGWAMDADEAVALALQRDRQPAPR